MSRMLRPLDVGGVRLRNRIIGAPMERNLAAVDGRMTDEYIGYLAARAAGGVALVFTESSYVRIDGKVRRRQMGVHDDTTIEGMRRLATAVHAHGALLGVELNHGGRTAQGRISGVNCVAPSPVPCQAAGGEVPLELDEEEIIDIIDHFAAAARRCVEAGVDVLSIHAAHGYLVHQFMSPRTNLRDDKWADPRRFLNAVIDAVRAAVPDTTVGMRISAFEGVPDGLDADATFQLINDAPLDKLDFLDVSAGCYEAPQWSVQPAEWAEGILGEYAARYRELGLPVSVAGRINSPETVERLLSDSADLVSMARALHADPEWVNAIAAKRAPRPCIACNFCVDQLGIGDPVPCSVNPWVGREHELGTLTDAPKSRKTLRVTVVGAGPSGLETARALARRGHRVRLVDREPAIGGDFRLAAGLHEYPYYHRILDWYRQQLDENGVAVRLVEEVDADSVIAEQADVVVLATGGRRAEVDVPGIDLERVVEIRDWMRAGKPDFGDRVHVVWGADREGVAVGDDLVQRGKRVVFIGGQHDLAPDVGRRARLLVVARLKEHPRVQLLMESRVVMIEPTRVLVAGPDGERWLELDGPILVSQGVTPDTRLQADLRARGSAVRTISVGEAVGHGGYIATAIADGARVAADLDAGRVRA